MRRTNGGEDRTKNKVLWMHTLSVVYRKKTLDGVAFGIDGEAPVGLDKEGREWFYAGLADGMSYDEAKEMALDWQRQEEKDRFNER